MAVLIVVGTTALLVVIARRARMARRRGGADAAVLDEPAGTQIAGIAAAGIGWRVQLQGGGPDRVVLVDPRTGAVAGRIGLRASGP